MGSGDPALVPVPLTGSRSSRTYIGRPEKSVNVLAGSMPKGPVDGRYYLLDASMQGQELADLCAGNVR